MVKFKNDLVDKLTMGEIEKIYSSLSGTRTRKTRILKHPERMNYEDIQIISEMIPRLSIAELIIQYKCGEKTITVEQLNKLGFTLNHKQ